MDVRLDGRSAIITGASTGLGLAMAKEFAASGADVAILARRPDVLEEGSLYWVVQGIIRCRQKLLGFDQEADGEGRKYCLFVLDPELVPVVPTQRGPFQGWRYLSPDAAPADLVKGADGELPSDEMLKELRSLGLI